jgi:hypothetical protein
MLSEIFQTLDSTIIDAKWVKDIFSIVVTIKTKLSPDDLYNELSSYEIEYSSDVDNGWVIHTRPGSDTPYAYVNFPLQNNIIIIDDKGVIRMPNILAARNSVVDNDEGYNANNENNVQDGGKSKSKRRSRRVTRKKRRGGRR